MNQNMDADALPEMRFGEQLCQAGIINPEQLSQALRLQKQSGGKIGELLLELGFISTQSLLAALKKKYRGDVADLHDLVIAPEAVNLLSLEKMKQYNVLPIAANARSVFLAMSDPGDITALNELEFVLGRRIQPVAASASQIMAALRLIGERGGRLSLPLVGKELRDPHPQEAANSEFPGLEELLRKLVAERASDLLLTTGAPPSLKKQGILVRLPYPALTSEGMTAYSRELLTESQMQEFNQNNDLDFTFTSNKIGRFRVNAFRQRNTISLAMRTIIENIPDLKTLGAPAWLGEFALRPHGLILISGPTGQGKSTTLAALVDLINSSKRSNIITIEEPIEYHYQHKLSNVNQREVGTDTPSFYEGLKRVFRQAPDVIVVGEIRDPESAAIVIQAASTGHLVLATLHANSATSTVERIIDLIAPAQIQQLRSQLSESLLLVLNQRLVKAKNGKGVVLAYEKLINTQRIRALIREGKVHQIRALFSYGADDFQTLDFTLGQLCREGKISQEEGMKLCENQSIFLETASRGKGALTRKQAISK